LVSTLCLYMVTDAGFFASAHDPALLVHVSPSGRTLLLLYMNGMIIIGDDYEYIVFVKTYLSDHFLMSDFGPLRYFLRIEISFTSGVFFVSKQVYSRSSRSSFSYRSSDY
jgi:hypothetical protein